MYKRFVFPLLLNRLEEPRRFIQVLLGPRQVGKTTLALQVEKQLSIPSHMVSADIATLQDLSWIETQWEVARNKVDPKKGGLLIIDEVQKIKHWSELVKKLWDEDTHNNVPLKVIILGSSPWLMQKGLSESLAGRFEIIPITHWGFDEMEQAFDFDLDQYIYFGGYPGAAPLAKKLDHSRWLNYINDSLIETTISRDILLMTQVNKPALLRRLFQLGCSYSGQILSYQKILGQLQDSGNTTTLAHYLDLLSGVGFLSGIQKFSIQKVRTRSSSPKLQVNNTALMSAQCGKSFSEAKNDSKLWGRLVESAVGAHLLNSIRGTQIELFYWREGNYEVDFILRKGKFITAIEVKSSHKKTVFHGMDAFIKAFHPQKQILIGENGVSIKEFLKTPINQWVSN